MSFTVRRACLADAQAIWQINAESLGYEYSLEDTVKNMETALQSGQEAVFVVCSESGVIAYVHAQQYRPLYTPPLVNLLAVAVAPAAQGCGAGRLLMQAAEQWAKDIGAKGVRLVSGENRARAHQFYLACGYAARKMQKNFVKFWG